VHENNSITDSADSRFQLLRSLQTPSGRFRSGQYLIEGIRHVARAAEERVPIQWLFLDPSALSNAFGRKLARRFRHSGTPCLSLSPALYRSLTLAVEPQGLGAVVQQQWIPLRSVRAGTRRLWLAVESIDSPGNLGTIIRTAEATGVAGIFVLGQHADPYEPVAVRASMGALFSQRLIRCSVREFIAWAKTSSAALVASSPTGLLDYRGFPCHWPAVLMIGSEKRGLSPELQNACDFAVRLPMLGRGDSINAAVAAGVLLYELFDRPYRPSVTPADGVRAGNS
jgi:TrmH family RNA methyltransferase